MILAKTGPAFQTAPASLGSLVAGVAVVLLFVVLFGALLALVHHIASPGSRTEGPL